MISLGKLSAGLAHELNNPASAIERSAALLENRLEESEQAARALGAARLTDAQLAAIDAARTSCLASSVPGVLSPIQQAEREDAIADWLSAHGLDSGLAGPLADTAVTLDALDRMANAVDGPSLDAGLRWTAAGCSVREIASEIQEAAMRITGLVMDVTDGIQAADNSVIESCAAGQNSGIADRNMRGDGDRQNGKHRIAGSGHVKNLAPMSRPINSGLSHARITDLAAGRGDMKTFRRAFLEHIEPVTTARDHHRGTSEMVEKSASRGLDRFIVVDREADIKARFFGVASDQSRATV
jgi:hypothetical protein